MLISFPFVNQFLNYKVAEEQFVEKRISFHFTLKGMKYQQKKLKLEMLFITEIL